MSILDEIFAHKRAELELRVQAKPLADVRAEAEQADAPLDFVAALLRSRNGALSPKRPALIAEIKRASPSRGLLAVDFDPLHLARIYQENGASAISVLTDERYFKGHLDYLVQIAALRPRLPLLRKDFLCDPYQLYEARAAGADAVLLIVAGLAPGLLFELHALACDLGMAPLVEVHSLEELQIALACEPMLVGVNNRNLHDFSVSLYTTLRLRNEIPEHICVVAESGIQSQEDVDRLATAGIDAILVGEALVTAPDIAFKVRSLAGGEL